jgi:hypothetical protein
MTFDFEDPGNPVEMSFSKNLFRQFYAQTSIFIIKVCFLPMPNADILDYGNDKEKKSISKKYFIFFFN